MRLPRSDTDRAALAATLAATAMIAQQVAGKAARDAFFLARFEIDTLPTMIAASAFVSIVAVRALVGRRPGWVPAGFAVSGVLLVSEWGLAANWPRLTAVVLYLHIAAFGSILVSGFWSLVTERFDPRTARRRMSEIAAGATLGGFAGGLLAERVAAVLSVTTMLPVLAVLHFACAVLVARLAPGGDGGGEVDTTEEDGRRLALPVLAREPYLRLLAYLVLLSAIGAALVDYAFKARAVSVLADGEALMRFFAIYYTVVGLLTFVIQAALSRRLLERLGLAGSVAALPVAVAGGSLGMLLLPGLATAAISRGAEAVMRSSLFRSGYEPFYSPLAAADRRATKTAIDVVVERLGDAVGAGVIKLLLLLGPLAARPAILALAAVAGILNLWICRRLRRGYVEALERGLLAQDPARAGDREPPPDDELRSVLLSVGDPGAFASLELAPVPDAARSVPESPPASAAGPPAAGDPVVEKLLDLRSTDPSRVRAVLLGGDALETHLVAPAIRLLAWDEVAPAAARALTRQVDRITGQLADALLDSDEEFTVRRRVPGVLAAAGSERAARALAAGLEDRRFEVRYRCGRALTRLAARQASLPMTEQEVFAAVLREVRVDRRLWEGYRLLDRLEDDGGSPIVDEILRARVHRGLEHVFTLLSLALPPEPLRVAFSALHTGDPKLRGTALEYLDSILPAGVREALWPFLEEAPDETSPPERPREQILAELMQSNESVLIRLEGLRGSSESDD